MSLKARIREIDGVDVIVAGPAEGIVKEHINDNVIPCSQVYAQNFELLFPTYIGPTCTVKEAEGGFKYVEMLYTPVESELESVKAQFVAKVIPMFELIDTKSTRAVRAIIYANTIGEAPNQDDIDVAKLCEETAVANRTVIGKINGAESLQWLKDNMTDLQPVNPWKTDDRMMM